MNDASPPPGNRQRATIVTLSRMAGVAPSTISRALKGDTRISAETRARIAALAQELGYTPNALARTLSSGRSGLIGLVLGPSTHPIYTEILHEAVAQAGERGMRMLMIHAGAGPIEDKTAEALLQYKVDGCLITSAELSSRAAAVCAANGVPVVMVNRVAREHGSAVACDNLAGGAELATLLMARGHRRFGMVNTSNPTSTAVEREQGFVQHLEQAGHKLMLRLDGQSTYDGGYEAGRRIAALPPAERPDAIFAVSDIIAMGVLDALRLQGIQVPQDISVVGFDDIPAAARPIYDLTTVAQPLKTMVGRGLDLLSARMADPDLPDESVTLRGKLIIRGSVRPAPG
ncbi:LacI family DNA-binding transcriptional regulator [Pseudoroseomonas wenyumeiae]|uniref:LacI family DNA-binding transcriptional regulator n=1 Tax=Teichococcus wenyumeiae TaxID=2478470 RepID=A0A3A9JDP1_9PROT|nr:LacI family DNA-binding transcriptional regulator [Pseudoroseomonas wenyumeiae]RKK02803.1 LacI family transcriptional regulator [Pseudoroseomonas wenyumeiae]RMI20003.1 LacI family DNA-binding transcriptional regulator [Pseudoroseomonas wenyumeiae]